MERLKQFQYRETAVGALSLRLKDIIADECQRNGTISVLLSGGTTPLPVYEELFQSNLDLSQVRFGLVDERFVEIENDASNEGVIRSLCRHRTDIRLMGMVGNHANYQESVKQCNRMYQPLINGSLVLLGMGVDGHFASLFPNDPPSTRGLSAEKPEVIATNAPAHPTERISTNLPFLLTYKHRILYITGTDKLAKFLNSKDDNSPIARIFDQLTEIYFAP